MTRDEVEHVLRAAAAIVREHSFVVVGSQAIVDWARRRAKEAAIA